MAFITTIKIIFLVDTEGADYSKRGSALLVSCINPCISDK